MPRRSAAGGPALVAVLLALHCAAAAPVLTSISPTMGWEKGGTLVTITGEGLPYFSKQVTVTVAEKLRCKRVRVLEPYRSITCLMPECPQCGSVDVTVIADHSQSNALKFAFESDCYAGLTPDLPRRYSADENCTICVETVGLTVSLMPDASSFESILLSMRDACQHDYFKSFGPLAKKHCRIDLSNACAILFHSHGNALADAIWNYWDVGEGPMYGQLAETVCAAVGRCPAV